jgi:hypothetical protein
MFLFAIRTAYKIRGAAKHNAISSGAIFLSSGVNTHEIKLEINPNQHIPSSKCCEPLLTDLLPKLRTLKT